MSENMKTGASTDSPRSVRVLKADFRHAITLYICKDGTVTYGRKGVAADKSIAVALPIYSVETTSEAEALTGNLCSRGYGAMDGRMIYDKWNYACRPDDLPNVYATFKEAHRALLDSRGIHTWEGVRNLIEKTTPTDWMMLREAALADDKDRSLADIYHDGEGQRLWLERVGADGFDRVIQ